MKILLATSNPHKLEEIRAILAAERSEGKSGPDIELIDLSALKQPIPEPIEDQPTFEGNAVLKARYYAQATGMICLADDSGLEVDALGGEPGVRSARYANASGPRSVVDPENNKLLLKNLDGVPIDKRQARFVCTMALCGPRELVQNWKVISTTDSEPTATLAVVRGTVEGRMLLPVETTDPACPHRGRGANGFGYDPLFLITELDHTTAELDAEHKNSISHRGRATRLLWAAIKQFAP